MSRTIEVAAGVLVENGRVLLGQRTAAQSFPHQWEFPGGKIEAGESPEEALEREFLEEVGIRVQAGDAFREIRYRNDRGDDIWVRFYLAKRVSGEPQPLEVQAVRWVEVIRLDAVDLIPFNRSVVDALSREA